MLRLQYYIGDEALEEIVANNKRLRKVALYLPLQFAVLDFEQKSYLDRSDCDMPCDAV